MFRTPGERVVVPGRRMPHQIVVLASCVLTGLIFLVIRAPAPNSLERLLDVRVLWAWKLMLLIGGAVGLVGSFMRKRPYQGLLAERASMILMTTAMLMYAVAIIAVAGAAGTASAAFILGWAASCVWRMWDIHKDLKILRVPPPKPGEPTTDDGTPLVGEP